MCIQIYSLLKKKKNKERHSLVSICVKFLLFVFADFSVSLLLERRIYSFIVDDMDTFFYKYNCIEKNNWRWTKRQPLALPGANHKLYHCFRVISRWTVIEVYVIQLFLHERGAFLTSQERERERMSVGSCMRIAIIIYRRELTVRDVYRCYFLG